MFNILISKAFAASGKLTNPLGSEKIVDIIAGITSTMIKLGAPIVGIMVIYGGFLILTAQDNPDKIKSGRDTIKWAVVGYIIILCAYGIVAVIKQVIGYTGS